MLRFSWEVDPRSCEEKHDGECKCAGPTSFLVCLAWVQGYFLGPDSAVPVLRITRINVQEDKERERHRTFLYRSTRLLPFASQDFHKPAGLFCPARALFRERHCPLIIHARASCTTRLTCGSLCFTCARQQEQVFLGRRCSRNFNCLALFYLSDFASFPCRARDERPESKQPFVCSRPTHECVYCKCAIAHSCACAVENSQQSKKSSPHVAFEEPAGQNNCKASVFSCHPRGLI